MNTSDRSFSILPKDAFECRLEQQGIKPLISQLVGDQAVNTLTSIMPPHPTQVETQGITTGFLKCSLGVLTLVAAVIGRGPHYSHKPAKHQATTGQGSTVVLSQKTVCLVVSVKLGNSSFTANPTCNTKTIQCVTHSKQNHLLMQQLMLALPYRLCITQPHN